MLFLRQNSFNLLHLIVAQPILVNYKGVIHKWRHTKKRFLTPLPSLSPNLFMNSSHTAFDFYFLLLLFLPKFCNFMTTWKNNKKNIYLINFYYRKFYIIFRARSRCSLSWLEVDLENIESTRVDLSRVIYF